MISNRAKMVEKNFFYNFIFKLINFYDQVIYNVPSGRTSWSKEGSVVTNNSSFKETKKRIIRQKSKKNLSGNRRNSKIKVSLIHKY